jgi:predicted Fe-S protein YdhL (DUF1289 family)
MKVCTLDATGRICLGCLRTADEVAAWASLSSGARARVVSTLPERHRLLEGQSAPLEPLRCFQCGTPFGCGANGPQGACWCTRYPSATPQAGATCLCPACLAAATS